ncbi:BZ3500_MvSof-1268-A1-R1_Chr1-1g01068 [Microbotryum saponariae]|uniref:BZ3500_MvSof-1268-A1-R1_Chr1-1g01068 protein n=1 Tax=Microbotryum saponariae TaxID=289078 RepID=A0A2X0MDK1_9BASI|nr:BZ3500_MvSof-1268-A1-R1_Chr1-1g01068 [Microbotryum saponariae]SCZ93345.1 BZ3501_MvSof-1269-A2-R1_Chr1-1g00665 [Microbotryum saponariae]
MSPIAAAHDNLFESPLDLVPRQASSLVDSAFSQVDSDSTTTRPVNTPAARDGFVQVRERKRTLRRSTNPDEDSKARWASTTHSTAVKLPLYESPTLLRSRGLPSGLSSPQPILIRRSLSLEPNDTQKVTLRVIAAYVVIIAILWHNLCWKPDTRLLTLIGSLSVTVKWILYPLKMLTIAFHEFGHAATGCCTGARIKSITLDPREGGCTMMSGGISAITLPAGYLGSSLIGALLIFCGFDIVASKIASFVLAVAFIIILWWGRKDWLTIVTILVSVGLLVAGWFIAHGAALRYEVLFIGVMSALYSVWDIFDDLILRKVNESDASVFAKRYGGSSACWGVLWAIVSVVFMAAGILCGLLVFKDSFSEQAADSAKFLPTRLLF